MTSALFQPLTIRGVTLANRIALSPMTMQSAEEGCAQPWHFQHYGAFAASGLGVVTIESTAVAPDGRIGLNCLGLYSDACSDKFGELVRFIKSVGQAKVGIQLFYSGRKGSLITRDGVTRQLTPAEGGWPQIAPSALPFRDGWTAPKEADADDIARLQGAWVDAARRAVAAGFDMVELHSAHGYGLHAWLSGITNRRTDGYGGSAENRMRFPLEVIRGIRAVLPDTMPFGMRISAVDGIEGGITLDESIAYVTAAKEAGIDYVCCSSGGAIADFRLPQAEGYQVPFAAEIRRRTGVITRAVGLIFDPHYAQSVIAEGKADFIALGRTLLDDPRWAFHAAEKLGEPLAYPQQLSQLTLPRWPRDIVRNAPEWQTRRQPPE